MEIIKNVRSVGNVGSSRKLAVLVGIVRNVRNVENAKSEDGRIKEKGFTLIEVVVAFGVFSIIVTIASSIFLGVLRDARFVSAQAAAVDNAGLVVEQIAREVRTGLIRPTDIPGSPNSKTLSFLNYHGENTVYAFDDVSHRITKNGYPITSANTSITGSFYITQPALTTPRVTVVAMVKDAKGSPLSNIQTTVSARLIYYKTP